VNVVIESESFEQCGRDGEEFDASVEVRIFVFVTNVVACRYSELRERRKGIRRRGGS
jgi:hypothetical protein